MVECIIIDDERSSIEVLKFKLENYCPDVKVVASFQDPEDAYTFLQNNNCDLIFLDIEMPRLSGFDLLRKLGPRPEKVIFITAYDQFAIQAVKCSALDYLLKPIDSEELIRAVEKVKEEAEENFKQKLVFLLENFRKKDESTGKLAIAIADGIEIVNIVDILYLKAESNYTNVYRQGHKPLMTSKTLKYYDEILSDYQFFRSHHKYLLPIQKVVKLNRADGGSLVLTDGSIIPISKRRKDYVGKLLLNIFAS